MRCYLSASSRNVFNPQYLKVVNVITDRVSNNSRRQDHKRTRSCDVHNLSLCVEYWQIADNGVMTEDEADDGQRLQHRLRQKNTRQSVQQNYQDKTTAKWLTTTHVEPLLGQLLRLCYWPQMWQEFIRLRRNLSADGQQTTAWPTNLIRLTVDVYSYF